MSCLRHVLCFPGFVYACPGCALPNTEGVDGILGGKIAAIDFDNVRVEGKLWLWMLFTKGIGKYRF